MYSTEVMERTRSALWEEGSSTTDKYIESLSKVEAMDFGAIAETVRQKYKEL
ncbi:hypothetical protein [Halobacillus hunanensis]|uniref:hypothetical protein n=1 Tax=Halobacillus hunanensis TaxID=578214 RepID=UPI0015910ED8|nr:hypothetical protein [Halobacillus hunanensis]